MSKKKKIGSAKVSSRSTKYAPTAKGAVQRARVIPANRLVSPSRYFELVYDFELAMELQARIGHTFRSISEENAKRAVRWHKGGLEEWSPLEWAGAMCGEAGEAANVAKKLRRFDQGIKSKRDPAQREVLLAKLREEIAGTFLYLDLLAQSEGIDLRGAVVHEFNRVSEREGFPERL